MKLGSRTRALCVLSTTAALAAAALAPGGPAAHASDYSHPAVVSEDAVDWTPHLVVESGKPKPVAYSIAEAGDQMVVGGRFTAVEPGDRGPDVARSNVFAFDATDGAIHEGFKPLVDGQVWAVASDGTWVYIGGNFKTVNGSPRPALARLNLATGALDTSFRPPLKGGRVSDIALHDDQVVVAGTIPRRLMSLDRSDGAATSYIPTAVSVTGKLVHQSGAASDAAQVFKFDISPDGRRLVAVGNFTEVAGQERPRVFMLDLGATAATLSSWNYEPLGEDCTSTRPNAIPYVQDVDFAPDSSWFALASFGFMYQGYNYPFDFQTSRRWYQICDSLSRFETNVLNPVQPTWVNYSGGDSLKSVAVTGAAVYTQGHSRWLDDPYGKDSKIHPAVDRLGGGAVSPNPGGYADPRDLNAKPNTALNWNPNMPQQSGGFQILPTAAGVWFVTDGTRFGGEYHRGIRFAPLP